MVLPASHALSGLTVQDGFKIQESIGLDLDIGAVSGTIAALWKAGEAKREEKERVARERANAPPTFRPIRDVIPYTEGRAMGWKLRDHCMSAKSRNWPNFKPWEFSGQSIAICGGGPSLGHNLHVLRDLQKRGTKVAVINRTQDYLLNLPKTHGVPWIKPWAGVLLEPTPNAANYMTPTSGVRYYISSQCAPQTFDKFEKNEHYIWHARAKPELEACLTDQERAIMVPTTGSTCGMRSIMLFYMMGFTDIHLFGFDSCYSNHQIENGLMGTDGAPRLHSYQKPETIHDLKEMCVKGFPDGDRRYFGNGNMLAQADEFQRFLEWRADSLKNRRLDPHRIIVHGFGLIPDIAREYGLHIDNIKDAA